MQFDCQWKAFNSCNRFARFMAFWIYRCSCCCCCGCCYSPHLPTAHTTHTKHIEYTCKHCQQVRYFPLVKVPLKYSYMQIWTYFAALKFCTIRLHLFLVNNIHIFGICHALIRLQHVFQFWIWFRNHCQKTFGLWTCKTFQAFALLLYHAQKMAPNQLICVILTVQNSSIQIVPAHFSSPSVWLSHRLIVSSSVFWPWFSQVAAWLPRNPC